MINKHIGLDYWKVNMEVTTFLNQCKQFEIELYDINIKHNSIYFYTHIWQRKKIIRIISNAKFICTTGMFGYLFKDFKRPCRLLCICISIFIWLTLSSMVFNIEIVGEDKEVKKSIESALKQLGYQLPLYKNDANLMKQQLKKKLDNKIAWLEIEKQGCKYKITYTPKEDVKKQSLYHDELIAKKDALIQRFDVQHGNKIRSVNEFVHKGDVLVSNVLEDSFQKNHELFVKGRVFGYVWKDITITMKDSKLPNSIKFYELLMSARNEISKDFHKDDCIKEENILQFSKDMGKIKLVVHYKLLQDITSN